MKRTHPAFWGLGWAGLFVGGLLTVAGLLGGTETAQLAGGYGLMMAGAAVYLLGGLGLKRSLMRRAAVAPDSASAVRVTTAPAPASRPQP